MVLPPSDDLPRWRRSPLAHRVQSKQDATTQHFQLGLTFDPSPLREVVARTAGASWTIADWLKRGRADRRLALAPGWPAQHADRAKAD